MIKSLYERFQPWSATGSIWILSDTHFEDSDCKLMDKDWITPEEQIEIINSKVYPTDTFIHLGDVGNPEWISKIRARNKILIMGNHDQSVKKFEPYFNEIYQGPLFIGEKILLSHEPIYGVNFCLNIHGHVHNPNMFKMLITDYISHLNLAANVCEYEPINLGKLIKAGRLNKIDSIHRQIINEAINNKSKI